MEKTILITGSTDGIGLETAKMLAAKGHQVLLHGRNPAKLERIEKMLREITATAKIESYVADLAKLTDVKSLADRIAGKHNSLDVLINNAGVFNVPQPLTDSGLDIRFVVNTIAPYLLVQKLLPLMSREGRIVNLSSAAQSAVDLNAFQGNRRLSDGEAYAQSKLALTMWSHKLGQSLAGNGPVVVAVNPGSMLGSKMVKEAFGVAGGDLRIGADVLCRAALDDTFASATGQYFDNDQGRFASPHPHALESQRCQTIIDAIGGLLD